MEIKLAEQIRAMRKERGVTQEQLAEVLGVTVGAVYKWEAGLSTPELRLIVELADFFDTSVDSLLGYTLKDNRLHATLALLTQYRRAKNRAGLSEAEKALKKYPNSFAVVYACAALYRVFAIEDNSPELPKRALELYDRARRLLPQNDDPAINEATLCGEMAQAYLALGQPEQAVALWKQHNAGGLYNDMLGMTLAADCGRGDEALPYLSETVLHIITALIRAVMGLVNVYLDRRDYAEAQDALRWGLAALDGLRRGEAPCFLDKTIGVLLVCLAETQGKLGDSPAAKETLLRAKALAARFDAAPTYRADSIRFAASAGQTSVYDDIGATALDGLRGAVRSMEDEVLTELWEEIEK